MPLMEMNELLPADRAVGRIPGDAVTWHNLVRPTPQEVAALTQLHAFHPLELEDCTSHIQLSKVQEHEQYLFIVLHFPRFSKPKRVTRPTQLGIFLGPNFLVTVHNGDLEPLNTLYTACAGYPELWEELQSRDSSYLLYIILDRLVDYLFPMLDKVLERLDAVEDAVFDENIQSVREVTVLRRDIADLRRILFPLRDVVADVSSKIERFSNDDLSPYFADVNDHLNKAWQVLEECKEAVEIFKDADYILNSEKSSRILAFLTILFTFSIPISTIGTLYGMNVNLPGGVQVTEGGFLGQHTSFILLCGFSLSAVLGMVWWFKRMKWL